MYCTAESPALHKQPLCSQVLPSIDYLRVVKFFRHIVLGLLLFCLLAIKVFPCVQRTPCILSYSVCCFLALPVSLSEWDFCIVIFMSLLSAWLWSLYVLDSLSMLLSKSVSQYSNWGIWVLGCRSHGKCIDLTYRKGQTSGIIIIPATTGELVIRQYQHNTRHSSQWSQFGFGR